MTAVEQELKLRLADPGAWDRLMASEFLLAAAETKVWNHELLEALYYDTPSGGLEAAKLAYRVRREDGRWIATVKGGGSAEGGLHRRREWSIEVRDAEPEIEPFLATEAGPLLQEALGEESLVPLFTTRFERHSLCINCPDGSVVEVAADRGEIIAGDRREPILEVELELKGGNPSALLTAGACLARELPLMPEGRSKYYRGLLLAGLAEEKAVKPGLPSFDGTEPAADALRRVCTAYIHRTVFSLERFLSCPEDPESLHQIRVSLRRLRSVLAFGKPMIDADAYLEKQGALKSWARELGQLRDIDVVIEAWRELVRHYPKEEKLWLDEILAEERKALAENVRSNISSGRYTPLLLEIWAWLEQDAFCRDSGKASIGDFAEERIDGWVKEIYKTGKETDLNDPVRLHGLRIQGKKLRYNLESFLLSGNDKTRKLISRLKGLQDDLGLLRDSYLIINKMDEITKERSSRAVQREAGMLKGWQLRLACDVRTTAERQWKRLWRTARKW